MRYVHVFITNPKFGTFAYAKILHETEKAYKMRGFHNKEVGYYKPKWVPKRYVNIIEDLHHCELHDRLFSDFCFDCIQFAKMERATPEESVPTGGGS